LFPEYIPSARFNKASQIQNALSTQTRPSHAATAQTRFYNAFASSLNRATAYRQTTHNKISVAHPILITSEKGSLCFQFLLTTFRQSEILRIIGHRTQNGLDSIIIFKKLLAVFTVLRIAKIAAFAKLFSLLAVIPVPIAAVDFLVARPSWPCFHGLLALLRSSQQSSCVCVVLLLVNRHFEPTTYQIFVSGSAWPTIDKS